MNVQDLTEVKERRRQRNFIANCIMDYALNKHRPQTYASYDVEQEFCTVVNAICDIADYDNEAGRELICGTYLADALTQKGDTAYEYQPTCINYSSKLTDKGCNLDADECYRDAHYHLYSKLKHKKLVDQLASQNINLGDDFAEHWDHFMWIRTDQWGMYYEY